MATVSNVVSDENYDTRGWFVKDWIGAEEGGPD